MSVRIEHIDDVLPHIEGKSEFIVAKREGYTAIDYAIAFKESFDDPICRECRGLKFDKGGKLIARPFHKFFNIGERESTQPHLVDFSKPHRITDKLDGSMVHPVLLDDDVVFMTRMGRSDQAMAAEKLFLTPELSVALRVSLLYGNMPIFEYTGPQNRHIIKYDTAQLTLLAGRNIINGDYLSYEECEKWAKEVGLSMISQVSSEWSDTMSFLNFVRVLQGKEGFVVHFDPAHEPESERWILKCKGEDYVLKHKSKNAIQREKNVLALILQNGLDDVLPLLSEEDKEAVERYRANVHVGLKKAVEKLEALVDSGAHLDQKTFAVEHLAGVPSDMRGLAFATRRGGNAEDEIRKMLLKNVGSQNEVDAIRHFIESEFTI